MKYLLRRTYGQDIKKYEKELLNFNVSYIKVNDWDEEEEIVTIIEITNIEELNKLNEAVGRLVIKKIKWELDAFDYEFDKDITKLIEIYDDYRE